MAMSFSEIRRETRRINRLSESSKDIARRRAALSKAIQVKTERMKRILSSDISRAIIRDIEIQLNAEGAAEQIIAQRFSSQSEHGPGSTRWQALKPSTIRRKGSNRILVDSGNMYQGAIAAVAGRFRIDPKKIIFNINDIGVDYARYHQDGDGVPRRRFFSTPNKTEVGRFDERIKVLLRKKLREKIRAELKK